MGFSMFNSNLTPIAADFGSSCVKLLQCSLGEKPQVTASALVEIPDADRLIPEQRMAFLQSALPEALRKNGFKGKKVVCSPQGTQTVVQHLQIVPQEAGKEESIRAALEMNLRSSVGGAVIRWTDVCEVQRDGQARRELICFAINRAEVMRHVELLKKVKLDVIGFHTEVHATLWAFDHLHRRAEDDNVTTLYVDLGWGGTKVAIAHGKNLVFAKYNALGGRHFDQQIMEQLKCDPAAARSYRQTHEPIPAAAVGRTGEPITDAPAMLRVGMAKAERHAASDVQDSAGTATAERRAGVRPTSLTPTVEPTAAPAGAPNVDISDLVEAIADDLCSCLRYHRALFPGRHVDRTIFLGGESRHAGLCQRIAQSLKMPAQVGDPLSRLGGLPGNQKDEAQPGWAVACGLCEAPTAI